MSERKTSEIKLRVTPSFKAAVQLAAEQAGETMSVYIESASQDRIDQEKAIARPVVKRAGWTFPIHTSGTTVTTAWAGTELPTGINPPVAQNQTEYIHTNSDPVPAKNADGSCTKNCHPWEWCECKQLRRD